MVSKIVHSSKKVGGSDNWQTPTTLFQQLQKQWSFDIDAAADSTNHLCPIWYGPEGLYEDALTAPWGPKRIHTNDPQPTHVFCNPPYSRVAEFVQKASEEAALNHATTVMLIPARTDTKWFFEYIYDQWTSHWRPHVTVVFIKGRVKFVDPNADPTKKRNSAPFPSMLVFFHAHVASRSIL